MKKTSVLIILVFLLSVPALANGKASVLQPEPLSGTKAPAWNSFQVVQADRTGKVFFFRADTFQVFPLTKAGAFDEPSRLRTQELPPGHMHDAVLSPGGNRWLVHTAEAIRLFQDGKEKPLPPLAWRPSGVAFLRDNPVVAVVPRPAGPIVDLGKLGAPPLLLQFDGNRWNPLVELRNLSAEDAYRIDLNDAIANYSVRMAGDGQGKLWMANQYAYRVQRLSAAGKLLLRIQVQDGKVRRQSAADVRAGSAALAAPDSGGRKGRAHPFTAQLVIRDLVEGRDGRMYFLVSGEEGGLVLDRYDPVRSVLERCPLSVKAEGTLSLAAGKDALYLAAIHAENGRWRLPWTALEEASWKEVEGAEISAGSPSQSPTPFP